MFFPTFFGYTNKELNALKTTFEWSTLYHIRDLCAMLINQILNGNSDLSKLFIKLWNQGTPFNSWSGVRWGTIDMEWAKLISIWEFDAEWNNWCLETFQLQIKHWCCKTNWIKIKRMQFISYNGSQSTHKPLFPKRKIKAIFVTIETVSHKIHLT